jgi:type IV pilus assembly protein PilC
MITYRYQAVDSKGRVVMAGMQAASEDEVAKRLTSMGYRPLHIAAAPAGRANSRPSAGGVTAGPDVISDSTASAKDLALFFRQFAVLVRSGISLFQALESLSSRTNHALLKRASGEMAEAARSGGTISGVMQRYPGLFRPHVLGSIRASEAGGLFDVVLDEIATEYETELAFYKGMWLPKMLVLQQLFAVALAQPLFPALFPNADFGLYLRLALLRNIPIAAGIVGAVWLVLRWLQTPAQNERRDALVLRMPIFGNLVRQRSLAAFIRMMRKLYNAGIGPVSAWEGAMHAAPNSVIRRQLVDTYERVRTGTPMHEAFIQTRLFSNESEQLLATGVLAGQVVEMLDKIADYYQENVERAFRTARFTLFRIGITGSIILAGVVAALMTKNYFHAVFHFTDGWTD